MNTTMTDKPKLPELLKQKRLELGESQSTFGKRFDRSHAAVSDWESGKTDIPNVVIEWVLFGKPSSGCSQNGNKLPEKLDLERIDTYPDPAEAMYAGVGIVNYELAIISDKVNAIISYIESKEHGK